MQNAKNTANVAVNTTVQTLQTQLNAATKDLFLSFDYEDMRKSIQDAYLGWISHDIMSHIPASERIHTTIFFQEFNNHIEALQNIRDQDQEALQDKYLFFLQYNRKDIHDIFKTIMYNYLCTDLADDLESRSQTVYVMEWIENYALNIVKLQRKNAQKIKLN